MVRSCRWLGPLLALLCSAPWAQADWPHLRGPGYDGVSAEKGLADSWPAGGPPRLWSRNLGQGFSGIIVAEGKAFTQAQTLAGQYLLCLDIETGKTLWEFRYDWPWQPKGAYPGPYATPTWHRGRVYYSSPTGLVGCVDAASGAPIWSLNVIEQFHGKGCDFGYAATPLLDNDRVVLPVGGPAASLVALHADDGRTVWTAGSDPASYCPALPIVFQGRRCIIGYMQNAVLIVDAATGKLLHRRPLSTGYDEHSAWPLYREPFLLLAGPFRAPAECLELKAGPGAELALRPTWSSRELANDVASSVLIGGSVYGFDLKQLQASRHRASRGQFKCLDWATGKLCWSTERVGQASVLAADGKLFLLNDTGSLILARADPAGYQELGRTQVFEGEVCWTAPTLSEGRLFLRSPSQAVCVHVGRAEKVSGSDPAPVREPSRSWRFSTDWLLAREREYPNDAFSWDELALWFAACLVIAFGGAAVMTTVVLFVAGRLGMAKLPGTAIFLACAFVLGLAGPSLLASLSDRCVFTWPASLYAAFHATLLTCWWAEQQPSKRRARWLARLAVAVFLLVAYAFFELCKSVGMFVGWSFLIGFLPAFPFALLAVRARMAPSRRWITAGWTTLAFTAFFWSCQGLLLWKSARSG
jgi:outer membrane protein assembly factor BamB